MDPSTSYVKSGDIHLAYQTVGTGERDLVYLAGIFSHIELQWENPMYARFLRRLCSFARLIMMDMRGTGLSDRAATLPLLEDQMEDLSAVLDRVGSSSTAILGASQAGPMAVLYAATHPERVDALILYAAYASAKRRDDYPWGREGRWLESYLDQLENQWGAGSFLQQIAPSMVGDRAFEDWWGRFERYSSSPGNGRAYARAHMEDDVRQLLSTVSVPTLVIQRSDDSYRDAGQGRYIAKKIPRAEYKEVGGRDHLPYVGGQDAVADEIEEFLTGVRSAPEPDRVLATILFTDIVDSTKHAAQLGDSQWRDLLAEHNRLVAQQIKLFRGRLVGTAGDGVLAVFDGPARAIRCALAINVALTDIGLQIRAGVHTGEVEVDGDDLAGIGVHIGARVASIAGPSEVMVSRTVKDLVAGSEIDFVDRGMHELKGVPESWQLFSVA